MDKSTLPPPLTDAEIHALLDDQVQGPARAALLARLQHDEAGRRRLDAWQAQRDALRELHRNLLDEPVPPALRDAAQGIYFSRQQRARWQRWGGLAATIVLAFGAGWLGRSSWPRYHTALPLAALPAFARDASVAHAVFTPEKRHPVEVTAAEQEHLVQWLSRRTGKSLKVPNLQAQGYELVGGRLLPGGDGARAQFMFQNTQGVRLTLYLGALAASSPEITFRFTHEGPVPGFYWVDQGFGYAVSGPLTREALMALAEAVYRQL
ncbi:MAG: anti-sigma factor [Hydrogenophaga sp.]|uniref:anti-sigma factor family protein n=1 Tax=Hydrogenophaga sp. TaxID=1904254 RepID=UPI003D12908B